MAVTRRSSFSSTVVSTLAVGGAVVTRGRRGVRVKSSLVAAPRAAVRVPVLLGEEQGGVGEVGDAFVAREGEFEDGGGGGRKDEFDGLPILVPGQGAADADEVRAGLGDAELALGGESGGLVVEEDLGDGEGGSVLRIVAQGEIGLGPRAARAEVELGFDAEALFSDARLVERGKEMGLDFVAIGVGDERGLAVLFGQGPEALEISAVEEVALGGLGLRGASFVVGDVGGVGGGARLLAAWSMGLGAWRGGAGHSKPWPPRNCDTLGWRRAKRPGLRQPAAACRSQPAGVNGGGLR